MTDLFSDQGLAQWPLDALLPQNVDPYTKLEKYSDSQERVPAGSPEGGEFGSGGGGDQELVPSGAYDYRGYQANAFRPTQELVGAIVGNMVGFNEYGLRIDERVPRLGQMKPSRIWVDSGPTRGRLGGVSTIGISYSGNAEEDVSRAIRQLGPYVGDHLTLVGGSSHESGDDLHESIIHDAVAIAHWSASSPQTTKAAHTLTISSGGKARDDALDPIVARVRQQLIDLVALHSNRNKRDVSDEERDIHGEWTADGGGSLTAEEFTARTGIPIDGAKKLDPRVAGPVLARLASLQDRFHTDLARIVVARDPKGPTIVGDVHPDNLMVNHGPETMDLNSRFFSGNKDPFKKDSMDWMADSSLVGQATHEFGHAVVSTMRLDDILPFYQETDFTQASNVSFYAQSNVGEEIAECFVHYVNGTKSDNPTVAALGSILDRLYPT